MTTLDPGGIACPKAAFERIDALCRKLVAKGAGVTIPPPSIRAAMRAAELWGLGSPAYRIAVAKAAGVELRDGQAEMASS